MSLLDTLTKTLLSDNTTNVLSEKSGADSNQVVNIVQNALPVLLQSMVNNSTDTKQSASLATALADHAKTKNTNTKAVANADTTDGMKIIQHLLGGNTSTVTDSLAKTSKASTSQVETILSSLAPTLMSLIGKQTTKKASSGLDLTSILTSILGGGKTTTQNSGFDIGSLVSMAMKDNDRDGQSDVMEMLSGLFGGKK